VEPVEKIWQHLASGAPKGISKVPHLSLADELFMGAIVNIPRPQREWGIISWMSDVFGVSRPTVYSLGKRVAERLCPKVAETQQEVLSQRESKDSKVEINETRMARLALTSAFPGKVALRSMQDILQEAFGESRSIGTLSQLLTEAGRRAGEVLRQVDHSPLGPVIVVRDETYFQDWPILLVIEPVSTTILLAEISPDCTAETWGAALLVAQDQGASIAGLIEDMASMYDKSQELAEMEVPVQKDPWHVMRAGGQVQCDLQREALATIKKVEKIEKELLKKWQDEVFFEQYIPAVTKMERLLTQHDIFASWFGHLRDALELVDLRSGEIRDRETNGWLLDETLKAFEQIDHPRVQTFVKTLRRHQDQLLTFLDWAGLALTVYEIELAQHIQDPARRQTFVRTTAPCWRLRQALINGHKGWRHAADAAEETLQALIEEDETLAQLAECLMILLDTAGHTSSLIECINGLLKSFLTPRRAFRNIDTARNYLNLFVLWHNMRVYQRGKRADQSPYQLATIDPGGDDWLALLGYPAAA
jgi:hypothetical protein